MKSNYIVRSKISVQLLGLELCRLSLVGLDAVNDEIEIVREGLDLRNIPRFQTLRRSDSET